MRVSVALTSSHLYPLINFVAASEAITFCGGRSLTQHFRLGQIAAVPLKDREMNERHFMVVKAAGRHLSVAVTAFLGEIKQELDAGEMLANVTG